MKIIRVRTTFAFIFSKSRKIYVVQISLRNPWWIPKCDKQYLHDKYTLYGWLFFYFGWVNDMKHVVS